MKYLLPLYFGLIASICPVSAQEISPEAWAFADSLIEEMTLEEKVGQMTLFTSDWAVTGPTLRPGYLEDVRAGKVGAIFNAHTSEYVHNLQRIAVEETRLGIPLLFGFDVVHGYRTIFPTPLGLTASWDMEGIEASARVAAIEASAAGLHWTFAPMVDIARDPRWGRITEGGGEDPYLVSRMAEAMVRGFQGEDIASENTILSCVKHYAAYGAAQAGRDYHTTDMSDRTLRDTYLPPYRAAIDAGAYTIMTAFNDLNGVPCTGNEYLLKDILRKEWGFKGMVVTDYTSVSEMVPHGIVADNKGAALLAASAGVDMDMQSGVFNDHLPGLVESGRLDEEAINQSVRYTLALKYMLGLFSDPYRYGSQDREESEVFAQDHRDLALELTKKSMVLLQNESEVLPLSPDLSLAVIGPLADNQADQLGNWFGDGKASEVITPVAAMKEKGLSITYKKGCDITGEINDSMLSEAIEVAEGSDLIVAFVGEAGWMSGEAASRSSITLPGPQRELIKALHETGKPLVLVLINGRPLDLSWETEYADAIVEAWLPGTMGGPAIVDLLTGEFNPSGRLPVTFPRNLGQVPIFHSMKNTGRPLSEIRYTSKYIDVENSPLFPFGYGLSYSEVEYSAPEVSTPSFTMAESIEVTCQVTNKSSRVVTETIQLYTRDLVGSVTRPVQELKGFQQVTLEPQETRTISFSLTSEELIFYTRENKWEAEPGEFLIQIGPNSRDVSTITVSLTE